MNIVAVIPNLIQYASVQKALAAANGVSINSFQALGIAIGRVFPKLVSFFTSPIGLATAAVAAIIGIGIAFNKINVTADEANQKMQETRSSYDETKSNVESLNSELETTRDRMNELMSKEHLSLVEQEELENLRETNAELERQIALEEAKAKVEARKLAKDAKETYEEWTTRDDFFGNAYAGNGYSEKDVKTHYDLLSKETQYRINNVIHNANASWYDKISSYEIEDIDLASQKDSINQLIATYNVLDDQIDATNLKLDEYVAKGSNLTDEEQNEVTALREYLESLEIAQVEAKTYMDEYYTVMSEVYNNIKSAMEEGAIEENDSIYAPILESLDDFMSFYGGKYFNAENIERRINGIFEKVEFDGFKEKLIEAGKKSQEALESEITPELKSALEKAGVDLNKFIDHIMNLAQPNKRNMDHIREVLKANYTPEGFKGGTWAMFTKDRTDDELAKFYDYVQQTNVDMSTWGLDDLKNYFNEAMAFYDEVASVDTEPISFASILKGDEKSPENFSEYVDKYTGELDNIKSALDNIKSGEFDIAGTKGLIDSIPELAGHTDNLKEIQSTLNELNYSKLQEFVQGYSEQVDKLTTESEKAAANDYLRSIISSYDFSDIKLDKNSFIANIVDDIKNFSINKDVDTVNLLDNIYKEFGGTEEGMEILATLSLFPDAATWTYEEWKANIEDQEVSVRIRLTDESILEIENRLSDIKNSKSIHEAENSAKESQGKALTASDYTKLQLDNIDQIALNDELIKKKQLKLDLSKPFLSNSSIQALEDEIVTLQVENIQLKSDNIDLETSKKEIPLTNLQNELDEIDRQISERETNIDRNEQNGVATTAKEYRELADLQQERFSVLKEQESWYNNTMKNSNLDVNDPQYIEWAEGLYEVSEAAKEATQSQNEYNEAAANIPTETFRNATMAKNEKVLEDAEKIISNKEARGEEITEGDYENVLDAIDRRISNLKSDNVLLEATATREGWKEGSEKWLENQDAIEENNAEIEELIQQQYEYNQALNELPIEKYQNSLEALQSQAELLQSSMDLNTINNKLTTEQDYKNLISNAESQQELINKIIAEKETLRDIYEPGSVGYNTYQNEINSLQSELIGLEQSIIDWSNTAKNLIVTNAQTLSSVISTALSEVNESTGLTAESIATLETQFSELSDMDTADLFYNTADGVKVSTDELKKFSKEQDDLVRAKFDRKIKSWEKAISDYQDEIGKGNVDDKLRGMQNELNDVMQQQSQYFATYEEQMESLSKFAQVEIALGTENQGAHYDAMQSNLESWKEMYDKGLIGIDDFQALSEYFNVDGLGFADNFQEDYKLAQRYITEDISGIFNFYDDLVSKGLATFDEASQSYTLMFDDVANAARTMNMGDEWFLDMLAKSEEYGAINTIITSTTDAALQTQELNQELFEAQKKLIELENAGASAEAIAQQEAHIASLEQQTKDVVDVEESYIEGLRENYIDGFGDIQNTLDRYNQYRKEALDRGDEETAEKWKELAEDLGEEYKIGIDLTDEGMKLNESDYQAMYDKIYPGKGSWENPVVPAGIRDNELYGQTFGEVITAHKNENALLEEKTRILSKYTAEQLKSLELNDGAYDDTFEGAREAEQALDAIAEELGLSADQAQYLAHVMEAFGQTKYESPYVLETEEVQEGLESLQELKDNKKIKTEVEFDVDTSELDIDELQSRLEGLKELQVGFKEDSSEWSAIQALIEDTEAEIAVKTVMEGGDFTIEELQSMDGEKLIELGIATQANVDEVLSKIQALEKGYDLVVHIDDTQFNELTSTEKTVAMDSSSIDEAQSKLNTLNETEINDKKLNVDSESAEEAKSKLDKINSTNIKDKSFDISSNSQDVLRSLSSVLTYMNLLDGKTSTLTINKVTKETKVSEATGTLAHGTLIPAHANGTAYNMLNLKPAFARGTDVGIDHDQEALVNELGMQKCRYKIYLIAGKP